MPFNKTKYLALLQTIKRQGLEPYGPRIVVLRDDADEESGGGIIIPDAAQKRPREGTVVMLCAGYAARAEDEFLVNVHVGKRVAFNAYGGVEFTIDTEVGKLTVILLHLNEVYLGWINTHTEEA